MLCSLQIMMNLVAGAHPQVVAKLEDIATKAKNSVAAVDPIRVMRCGNQTRSIFTIKVRSTTISTNTGHDRNF